jgi:hypothetical protein
VVEEVFVVEERVLVMSFSRIVPMQQIVRVLLLLMMGALFRELVIL